MSIPLADHLAQEPKSQGDSGKLFLPSPSLNPQRRRRSTFSGSEPPSLKTDISFNVPGSINWKRGPEAAEFHSQRPIPTIQVQKSDYSPPASSSAPTSPSPDLLPSLEYSPIPNFLKKGRTRSRTANSVLPPNLASIDPQDTITRPPKQHKKISFTRFLRSSDKEATQEIEVENLITDIERLHKTEAKLLRQIEELKEKEKNLLQSCSLLSGKTPAAPNTSNRKKRDIRKVNTRDISICERLGSGFSGAIVYSCIVDGWVCAMKQLASENKIEMESFEREMNLLYSLPPHPNIVRYLFHNTINGKLCLYMTRHATTLQSIIHTKKEKESPFSENEIISVASKIIAGIEFLHDNQIIHRDIKTENIYCTPGSDGELKEVVVADFDSAKRTGAAHIPQSTIGTLGYMAPEVFNSKETGAYSHSADIFSFGMVLYSLITLEEPFYNFTNPFKIYVELQNNCVPILLDEQKERYTSELLQLHRNCILVEPSLRPKSNRIKQILEVLLERVQLNEEIQHIPSH